MKLNSSKIARIYDDLRKEQSFTLQKLDDNNQRDLSRMKYCNIDTIYNGKHQQFIIRDGNTYLLRDTEKILHISK